MSTGAAIKDKNRLGCVNGAILALGAVSIVLGSLLIYLCFQVLSLSNESIEKKRDAFIVQIVESGLDGGGGRLLKKAGVQVRIDWAGRATDGYDVVKDTGLGSVTYLICFDNGSTLFIETLGMTESYYGGAIFEIGAIGFRDDTGCRRGSDDGAQFYLIGDHRVYCL